MKHGLIIPIAALLFYSGIPSARALDDGLYAVFHTSMGSFTAQLFYEEAPMTVANFVGLAEGSRTWMDEATGAVRSNPFYDGGIFHRVISGFMIQAGSRNQLGTDGPGYRFPDEIPNNRFHAHAGMLSMANSGLDSNGSQFFVTVTNTPWLDGVHTVFGQVVSGQAVVDAISQVSVDTNNNHRPFTDVIIHSVEIDRIGPDAEAFDGAEWLPVVGEGRVADIQLTGNALTLNFEPELSKEYYVRTSSDLENWSTNRMLSYAHAVPEIESVYIGTNLSNRSFFSITELQYPGNEYSPGSLSGRSVQFTFAAPLWIAGWSVEYLFGNELGNVVRDPVGGEGVILFSRYNRFLYPNRSALRVIGSSVGTIDYRMEFETATNGVFTGIMYWNPRENFARGFFHLTE